MDVHFALQYLLALCRSDTKFMVSLSSAGQILLLVEDSAQSPVVDVVLTLEELAVVFFEMDVRGQRSGSKLPGGSRTLRRTEGG